MFNVSLVLAQVSVNMEMLSVIGGKTYVTYFLEEGKGIGREAAVN